MKTLFSFCINFPQRCPWNCIWDCRARCPFTKPRSSDCLLYMLHNYHHVTKTWNRSIAIHYWKGYLKCLCCWTHWRGMWTSVWSKSSKVRCDTVIRIRDEEAGKLTAHVLGILPLPPGQIVPTRGSQTYWVRNLLWALLVTDVHV